MHKNTPRVDAGTVYKPPVGPAAKITHNTRVHFGDGTWREHLPEKQHGNTGGSPVIRIPLCFGLIRHLKVRAHRCCPPLLFACGACVAPRASVRSTPDQSERERESQHLNSIYRNATQEQEGLLRVPTISKQLQRSSRRTRPWYLYVVLISSPDCCGTVRDIVDDSWWREDN